MGGGTFDPGAYRAYTSTTTGKSTSQIYSSRNMHKDLDPKGVKVRESRDSVDNPNSTPVMVGLDVTGSMGMLADVIAREGLGVLFQGILDRKPVRDPHIAFMGIGDVNCDSAPLQVSQFEADNRIVEQVTQLYIEHGGGGNGSESYHLPWYFAAFHTEHDSIEKRGKRGYLFTVGDEGVPPPLSRSAIKQFIGDDIEVADFSAADLLALAQRKYDVFHVVILEGWARSRPDCVDQWRQLLGERVIPLKDHKKLAETIVSAIEVAEGRDAQDSAKGWGASAGIVHDAVKHLPRGSAPRPMLGGPR